MNKVPQLEIEHFADAAKMDMDEEDPPKLDLQKVISQMS